MSKIENNRIYYDPYNEIRCDKFALENFVKESEEKDKTIADLEAKLAESEQEVNNWKQRFGSSEERFKTFNSNGITALNLKNEKIEELKQQLAEKEEQLEWANKQITEAENQLEKQASIHYGHIKEVVSKIDQDKISFAVEQLEKVLVLIQNAVNLESPEYDLVGLYDAVVDQIKQLKEMPNEK